MHKNSERTSLFKKSNNLEEVLKSINDETEELFKKDYTNPSKPIILIMGCPRSGSTLLLQWLSSLGIFSYPSNLIARFYKNPYLGIKIQQALLEFDPLNQLGFNAFDENNFSSKLGKTFGALSPSEYWYFWREYFKFGDINTLDEDAIKNVNSAEFLAKLGSFEMLTSKIPVMKGMIMNWNIPDLLSIYPNFLIINIERDPFFNAQSLIFAREKYFNDRNKWYSFKPPEYTVLKDKDYITQVAGQVEYTKRAVSQGLGQIPDKNQLTIKYEYFCQNPKLVYDQIINSLNKLNYKIKPDLNLTNNFDQFNISNKILLNNEQTQLLKQKIAFYHDN